MACRTQLEFLEHINFAHCQPAFTTMSGLGLDLDEHGWENDDTILQLSDRDLQWQFICALLSGCYVLSLTPVRQATAHVPRFNPCSQSLAPSRLVHWPLQLKVRAIARAIARAKARDIVQARVRVRMRMRMRMRMRSKRREKSRGFPILPDKRRMRSPRSSTRNQFRPFVHCGIVSMQTVLSVAPSTALWATCMAHAVGSASDAAMYSEIRDRSHQFSPFAQPANHAGRRASAA